mmetsp:Transcript_1999/g.2376  ORF Transcript_1999/g.2376 Transcript_1999/m.2376 type:complete len:270 (-) Transcript_1999:229-1038(-)
MESSQNNSQSSGQLEQFVLLAKNTTGKATVAVLTQVLKHKNVYVFAELRELKCVQALNGTEHQPHLDLLNLFSYGTYEDYKKMKNQNQNLPTLTETHLKKLRQLSLVSYASKHKTLNYESLLVQLEIDDVRNLEDLIISCVYAGLIKGKLDQLNRRFHVYWAMGRDLHPNELDEMVDKLGSWCGNAEKLMATLVQNIESVKKYQEEQRKQNEAQRKEFHRVKETLQRNALDDMESSANAMDIDSSYEHIGTGKTSRQRRGGGGPPPKRI